MGTAPRWLAMILAATVLDLLLRLGVSPGLRGVLWGEAVLFALTAAGLLLLRRSRPALSGLGRALQVLLIWAFLLAGVRSGTWAAGAPVTLANLLVFVLAIVAWAIAATPRCRSRTLSRSRTAPTARRGAR